MKIRNKITGEEIIIGSDATVSKESRATKDLHGEDFLTKWDSLAKDSDERIANRGTIQGKLKSQFEKSELMGKLQAGLTVLGIPANAIESAIANPALLLQQNNMNKKDTVMESLLSAAVPLFGLRKDGETRQLLDAAVKGVTLQEQGQYGDVLKNAGINKDVADGMGLAMNVTGALKVFSVISNSLGNISKMSDKGILKSGKLLVNAADQAKDAVGIKVGQAFSQVDDVVVDGTKFFDTVVEKLSTSLLNKIEKFKDGGKLVFGKLDDFSLNLNIGKLREFKRFLGKLRPDSFEKGAKGAVERLDDIDLNKVYGVVKQLMDDTIRPEFGDATANYLMKMEKTYSSLIKSSTFIKKTVVDPTIKVASKAGSAASKIAKEGDATLRISLNAIRNASKESARSINQAVRLLNHFNSVQSVIGAVRMFGKAAVFGGAAGAIGGKVLKKVSGDN